MRVAVTYENGTIFQHFGHTKEFKIYDIKDGKILTSKVVNTQGQGHSALTEFLSSKKVDTLICGGIGDGAQQILDEIGIKLYGDVHGMADDAVKSLLDGKLISIDNPTCAGHNHDKKHFCGRDDKNCKNSYCKSN